MKLDLKKKHEDKKQKKKCEIITGFSKKSCVFSPFLGEFGIFIVDYIRFVHFFKCQQKIVCCRRGEEIYFPSANDFYIMSNDYNFIEDKDRAGCGWKNNNIYHKQRNLKIQRELSSRYRGYEIVDSANCKKISCRHYYMRCAKEFVFKIDEEKIKEKLDIDVIIAPRKRDHAKERNYPHWDYVFKKLHKKRISYGIVGKKNNSYASKYSAVNSWDFKDCIFPSGVIGMMKKSKLYIGSDTGPTHLAAFLSIPMIIFDSPFQKGSMLKNYVEKTNRNYVNNLHSVPWNNPDYLVKNIVSYIKNKKGRKSVCVLSKKNKK